MRPETTSDFIHRVNGNKKWPADPRREREGGNISMHHFICECNRRFLGETRLLVHQSRSGCQVAGGKRLSNQRR